MSVSTSYSAEPISESHGHDAHMKEVSLLRVTSCAAEDAPATAAAVDNGGWCYLVAQVAIGEAGRAKSAGLVSR